MSEHATQQKRRWGAVLGPALMVISVPLFRASRPLATIVFLIGGLVWTVSYVREQQRLHFESIGRPNAHVTMTEAAATTRGAASTAKDSHKTAASAATATPASVAAAPVVTRDVTQALGELLAHAASDLQPRYPQSLTDPASRAYREVADWLRDVADVLPDHTWRRGLWSAARNADGDLCVSDVVDWLDATLPVLEAQVMEASA